MKARAYNELASKATSDLLVRKTRELQGTCLEKKFPPGRHRGKQLERWRARRTRRMGRAPSRAYPSA